jgi:hypothetical protein
MAAMRRWRCLHCFAAESDSDTFVLVWRSANYFGHHRIEELDGKERAGRERGLVENFKP